MGTHGSEARPLIAHIIHRLDTGGMENGVVNLLNHLPNDAYRHAVVCMTEASEFRQRIGDTRIPIIELRKREGKDPRVYRQLYRELRSLSPEMVHTRNLATVECQWVARLAGVNRSIHGEHGWDVDDVAGTRLRNRWIRKACRPAVGRYIAVSSHIKNYLVDRLGVSERRIDVIVNGVDITRFYPRTERDTTPLPDKMTNPESFVIGTVGRLAPVKAQADLIRSFSQLCKTLSQGRNLILVIVGDGPELHSLTSLANRLGLDDQVLFTGETSDTAAYFRSFDVFVLPSVIEGISNTILEAMATGLPVIAGDVGGNPELIVDGETGLLYPVRNLVALGEAIAVFINQPELRKRHGMAGRARVEKELSLDRMVQRYDAVYRQLLGTDRSAGETRCAV